MSLKHEPSSEPLHISAKQLFLNASPPRKVRVINVVNRTVGTWDVVPAGAAPVGVAAAESGARLVVSTNLSQLVDAALAQVPLKTRTLNPNPKS